MEQSKNMGSKIGTIVFLIISILLGGYIVYDKVLTTNNTDETIKTESKQNELLVNVTSNDKNPSITSLTIDNVNISEQAANDIVILNLTGSIDLSIDDKIYDGVSLEGYCTDANNHRYEIYGPQDGRALFHNGSNDLSVSRNLGVIGTININDIKIKYCKIDKMVAYVSTTGDNNLSKLSITKALDLNYEKSFN